MYHPDAYDFAFFACNDVSTAHHNSPSCVCVRQTSGRVVSCALQLYMLQQRTTGQPCLVCMCNSRLTRRPAVYSMISARKPLQMSWTTLPAADPPGWQSSTGALPYKQTQSAFSTDIHQLMAALYPHTQSSLARGSKHHIQAELFGKLAGVLHSSNIISQCQSTHKPTQQNKHSHRDVSRKTSADLPWLH